MDIQIKEQNYEGWEGYTEERQGRGGSEEE
jgi:hypothetical protein